METDIILEVRGAEYKVDLTEKGEFWTVVGDQSYKGDSLEKLREKVLKATRQSNLDIRFCRPNADGSVRYGIVTGIHGSQRAVLVKWNDGPRETIQSYSATDMLQPLDNDQARRFAGLVRTMLAAMEDLQRFKTEHKLNAWVEASEAAKAAVASDDEK